MASLPKACHASTLSIRHLFRRSAAVPLSPSAISASGLTVHLASSRAFSSSSRLVPQGSILLTSRSATLRFKDSGRRYSPLSTPRHASTSSTTSTSPTPSTPPPFRQRPLPALPSRTPKLLFLAVVCLVTWSAFTLYAMNAERASSAAFRSVLSQLKDDRRVHEFLGGKAGEAPVKGDVKWYAGGKVWVGGSVNMMQGRIDIRFGIKGAKDTATVYFTSFRPTQYAHFETLRFLVVNDRTGEKISLLE